MSSVADAALAEMTESYERRQSAQDINAGMCGWQPACSPCGACLARGMRVGVRASLLTRLRPADIAKELGVTVEPVRIDSQCKYAVVARGDSSVYLRLSSLTYKEKIWDHAAGLLVVEEGACLSLSVSPIVLAVRRSTYVYAEAAGGRVTDFEGNRLDFSHGDALSHNVGIVCTNGLLHEQVLAAIRRLDVVGTLRARAAAKAK